MKPAESYFCPEVVGMFDDLMQRLGAIRVQWAQDLSVRYEGPHWFVECFALAEDGPNYSPRIAMGPLPEMGWLPRDKQVDIMHALPKESQLSRYNLEWRYSDASTMRAVFRRVRDEIFIPFAVPILFEPLALETLVRERSNALNRQWKDEIKQHNLSIIRRRAAAAWQAKDYSVFLKEMEAVPDGDMSPVDVQRIAFASKHR